MLIFFMIVSLQVDFQEMLTMDMLRPFCRLIPIPYHEDALSAKSKSVIPNPPANRVTEEIG